MSNCSNCGVNVRGWPKECPNCHADIPGRHRALFISAIIRLAAFLGFVVLIFFIIGILEKQHQPAETPTTQVPTPVKNQEQLDPNAPAEFAPVSYSQEKNVIDAYNNLNIAVEHQDLQYIRNAVSGERHQELEKEGIDLLDAVTPDITFENLKVVEQIERPSRALLVFSGSSNLVTDEHGNPATATGIYKFVREEKRWKLRLLMWHIHPPTDPVPEAITWVNNQ